MNISRSGRSGSDQFERWGDAARRFSALFHFTRVEAPSTIIGSGIHCDVACKDPGLLLKGRSATWQRKQSRRRSPSAESRLAGRHRTTPQPPEFYLAPRSPMLPIAVVRWWHVPGLHTDGDARIGVPHCTTIETA